MAAQHQLGLFAVSRAAGSGAIPVPAVVHFATDHYAAVVEQRGDFYKLVDRPMGGRLWLTAEELNRELTGFFLVPALLVQPPLQAIDLVAAGPVVGKQACASPKDEEDGDCDDEDEDEQEDSNGGATDECEEDCPPGGDSSGDDSGCSGCSETTPTGTEAGMPRWKISEPQLNIVLKDMPLAYRPSTGPWLRFRLRYQQRSTIIIDPGQPYWLYPTVLGHGWGSGWLTKVFFDPAYPDYAVTYLAGGRRLMFDFLPGSLVSKLHYRNKTWVEVIKDPQTGNVTQIILYRPRGSKLVYMHPYQARPNEWLLKYRYDRHGRCLTYNYNAEDRLISVVDADGNTTSLEYLDPWGRPDLVTQVIAPGSRSVGLAYDPQYRHLTSITDAAGIVTTMTYDGGTVASITTPYGTTSFSSADTGTIRSVVITEPGGTRQAYAFYEDATLHDMPPTFTPDQEPDDTPFSDETHTHGTIEITRRQERNSFYWNRRQWAALGLPDPGNPDFTSFTWAELGRARIRHWLLTPDGLRTDGTLGHEQAPSPDGTIEGQVTFYDYDGKTYSSTQLIGTQVLPAVVAHTYWDGAAWQTWWKWTQRNGYGKATLIQSRYTKPDGTIDTRTIANRSYETDDLRLKEIRDGNGNLRTKYTYDATWPRKVNTKKVYVDAATSNPTFYETAYTYDGTGRLSSETSPAGLTTTYTYSGGYLSQISRSPVGGSESFTYSNNRLASHTDVRGFLRTFSYDGLNRTTRIDYGNPATTYEEWRYTDGGSPTGTKRLDVTWHRDRLGTIAQYAYNGLRQVTDLTDRRGNVWHYDYCDCGSLERITDPLGNKTQFGYDQAGRRTSVAIKQPNDTIDASTTYAYNLLGQMTSETVTINAQNSVRTHSYNNQGLRVSSAVNSLVTGKTVFDSEDRPQSVTDNNGVTVTQTFDFLGRVTRRDYPDGGYETFAYTARGLTSYQRKVSATLTTTTSYAYDEARRKTSETPPNGASETLNYTYDAAGSLLTFRDGRTNTTTWTYDLEGRVASKKYQGQTFANLVYGYDANSRLTSRRFYSSAAAYRETLYSYDNNGNLTTVNYPNPTADLTFTYDTANRVTQMSDAYGTTALTYNAAGDLLTEDGPLTGTTDLLTYSFANNSARLRTGLTLNQPGGGTFALTYAYGLSRRLASVTRAGSPNDVFSYTYKTVQVGGANYAASLVQQIALPSSLSIVNDFTDPLQRLISTQFKDSGAVVKNSHTYAYNNGSQRTSHTRGGNGHSYGGTSNYGYDNDGQLLTSSLESLTYGYDAGWNMTSRSATTYTINDRNQVTSIGGLSATYDANGNRTSQVYDSNGPKTYTYTYDDENQLTSAATDTYYTPEAYRWRTDFVYDGRMRLRKRIEYIWYYGGWQPMGGETRYIYDGLLVVQERGPTNPTISYARGLDLSSTLQGAGGIGGLLSRSRHATSSPYAINGTSYYHADGNGNITYLAGTSGAADAAYKYDPFGRTLASTGTYAVANVYRFSSKEVHVKSGMYYYGYRFYDPNVQRWLSRDPIGEPGGLNLYGYVANNPVNVIDPKGLDRWHGDSIHTYVVVEVWDDKCCEVIGYKRIEFGPRGIGGFLSAILTLGSYAPGEVTITDADEPPGWNGWRNPSSCQADKFLLEWAESVQSDPDFFNFWGQNCRHFSAYCQNVGIVETDPSNPPPSTIPPTPTPPLPPSMPFYPPVLR
ncbi:MAG: hypothetical protein HYY24_09800 [Verrucomicrobia bacterium]|nr:hypothetical protein [Verrucomicrobiota bacterium]